MGVTADVDGLAALAASAADAAVKLLDLDQVNADAATLVVQAVEAPRRTGRLAESVTALVDADGFTLTATAPYAPYVHARNPFLTRALDAQTGDVAAAYEQHVIDVVDTITGA